MFFLNRCLVPECDDQHNPNYDEPWVIHAVPSSTKGFSTFMPEQCERFESNRTMSWTGKECPAGAFSKRRLTCDRWVFDNYERTIVNDVCFLFIVSKIYFFQWHFHISGQLHAQKTNGCSRWWEHFTLLVSSWDPELSVY